MYNALFYSVLVYIQQLNMFPHVKYRNSNFTRIEINLNNYAPQIDKKMALNIVCRKNIQYLILLCFGVYTPTQFAL